MSTHFAKLDDMLEEAGVTEHSLTNAIILLRRMGKPEVLDFRADKRKNEFIVTATWVSGHHWVFTGFAWGYAGTGPSGLNQFLELLEIDERLRAETLPIDKYGKSYSQYLLRASGDPVPVAEPVYDKRKLTIISDVAKWSGLISDVTKGRVKLTRIIRGTQLMWSVEVDGTGCRCLSVKDIYAFIHGYRVARFAFADTNADEDLKGGL